MQHFPYWQYGTGQHSSETRKNLGSVVLSARTDHNNMIHIRHLVIEGSSQWIIGRNVTRFGNIIHIGTNRLELPDFVSLVDNKFHSFVPYKLFLPADIAISKMSVNRIFCVTAQLSDETKTQSPWSEVKKVIDKVHTHVCGHSSYSDIKTLLERNQLWNVDAQKYLATVLEKCSSCATTHEPKASRKVSLSTLNREFNEIVCIDYLHLRGNTVFHMLDSVSRYSIGDVVDTTAMTEAISVFELQWNSQFGSQKAFCLMQRSKMNSSFHT